MGISLTSQENRGYKIQLQARKPAFNRVLKDLKIYRYWVFCVDLKHFPSDGEWVDILYSEIDESNRNGSSKLIIL